MSAHRPLPSHVRLGLALLDVDRPEEAREALQAGAAGGDVEESRTSVPLHHWALAYSSWLVGRWDGATIEVNDGLAAAEGGGKGSQGAAYAGVGVVVAVHRDDLEGARALLARVQRQLATDIAPCPLWSQGAEALLVEAEGQPEAALRVMAEGWDRAGSARHLSAYRLFGPELVRLALAADDWRRAVAVAEDVEERAGHVSALGAQAAALRCRGLVDDAPAALLDAVTVLRQRSRPLELASTCEQAAASLGRAGQLSLASSLLGQARTAYQRLGATRDLARIAAVMSEGEEQAAARAALAPSSGRPGGAAVGAELSDRELEVLELLVAGVGTRAMAERLFVSHHTVRNHAQSILRKLGVHSRLEAVSLALREGLVRPPGGPGPSGQ